MEGPLSRSVVTEVNVEPFRIYSRDSPKIRGRWIQFLNNHIQPYPFDRVPFDPLIFSIVEVKITQLDFRFDGIK